METLDGATSPAQSLPGTIPTDLDGQQAVIWLEGDVDLAMAGELSRVPALPQRVGEVVLDVSGMTFCDGTLTDFIDAMLEHRTVRLRQPRPLTTEFLRAVGLADRLCLVTGPPTVPAPALAACT